MNDKYLTSQTLLQRIKDQQDDHSWEEFVYFYQNFIYSIIRDSGLDAHQCKDLTQEVLLKLWEKLPEFNYDKNRGGFRYWLYRVTKNVVSSYFAKKSRREELMNKALDKDVFNLDESCEPQVNDWIDKEWEVHITNLAFENVRKKISEKAVKVFLMLLDDVPIADIAQKVGVTENTVYVYRSRVRDHLTEEVRYLRSQLE